MCFGGGRLVKTFNTIQTELSPSSEFVSVIKGTLARKNVHVFWSDSAENNI